MKEDSEYIRITDMALGVWLQEYKNVQPHYRITTDNGILTKE